jgi:hypothetical protein
MRILVADDDVVTVGRLQGLVTGSWSPRPTETPPSRS